MTDLYPEPPHLSVFVAPGMEQSQAFEVAWHLLLTAGCEFTGDVLVAREPGWFRDVSDVEREVTRHRGSPRELLAAGDVLRAQFRHRSMGLVALGVSSAAEVGETRPLEIAIHAGPLSLPVAIWSKQDRKAAKRAMGWCERLMLDLAKQVEAPYGAVGIEAEFPSLSALASARRSPLWPTTWFWSTNFGAEEDQNALFSFMGQGSIARSNEGALFRAWQPWVEPRTDESSLDRVVEFLSHAASGRR